jgi:putative oxidoreductase
MPTNQSLERADMNDERTVTHYPFSVDFSLLVLRVIGGTIMAAHGAQKMFGAWGGQGLAATVANMGPVLGYLVPIGEFFGGLGLIFGFLTRFSAASNIVIMIGAIAMVHGQNGFFAANKGFEYNLAIIGLLLPVLLCGPGRLSVAHCLMPRSERTGRPNVVIE